MGTIALTKHLSSTPHAVFDTITHPATWEHWFSIHRCFVGAPPQRLAEDSVLTSKVALLGMTNEIEWTVTAAERSSRIALLGRGKAGVRCEFTYLMRDSGGGTELAAGGDFSGPLITGLLARALEKQGRDQLGKTLDLLAAHVAETGPPR
ncbi:type II toxin-antitoxin system Rv0910 family toxin [Nocardia mangyaensis]|uniref:type II toxin-antitoxin system Rv0910 family toxin n=1 Tax=Nocardia mangyaensis TaxID=2213200 RepID=UPI00267629CF|nr:SRPBCC family protein [Nocardia mangyaensis]MDO3647923.1 SRPBCC family protein [Nocardia mangyaensis]